MQRNVTAPANVAVPARSARSEVEMVERICTALLIAATVLLAACNTVEGAGKDVASAGNAVANTAQEAK